MFASTICLVNGHLEIWFHLFFNSLCIFLLFIRVLFLFRAAKAPGRAERTQAGQQAGSSAGGSNNPQQQQQPQPPQQQQHQGAHAVHPTPAETDLYRRQRKEGRKRK